ncbi:unnamed protein product [Taenia asiatica]|uniref:Transmembrane protein n=1 Tax=Taenia asiatica TaxID=60517 RepID=A0A0R3WG60_TAEAS|nr:unnamed protein product [Taenia asiatica]
MSGYLMFFSCIRGTEDVGLVHFLCHGFQLQIDSVIFLSCAQAEFCIWCVFCVRLIVLRLVMVMRGESWLVLLNLSIVGHILLVCLQVVHICCLLTFLCELELRCRVFIMVILLEFLGGAVVLISRFKVELLQVYLFLLNMFVIVEFEILLNFKCACSRGIIRFNVASLNCFKCMIINAIYSFSFEIMWIFDVSVAFGWCVNDL